MVTVKEEKARHNEKKRMEISITRRRNLRIITYSNTEVSISELGKI